ncbi:MAG: hypothetical protein PWQ44_1339, partial [Methanolobus sp.]|nr:hypothetical protein [Methanolobus sp.]
RELIEKWVEAFNNTDSDMLAEMYSDAAVNYQVPEEPVEGKKLSKRCLRKNFPVLKWSA